MVTYRVVPRLPIQLMQALEMRAPIVVPIENDDPVGNWKLDNHVLNSLPFYMQQQYDNSYWIKRLTDKIYFCTVYVEIFVTLHGWNG